MDFLISDAMAQSGAAGQGSPFPSIIMLLVLFALFYFLLIRPQQKRAKEHREMTEKLTKGDEVMTQGGILGRITNVSDTFITLEIAEGTEVKMQRGAVSAVLPKGTIKAA